jgi:serine/threonine protein kinase
VWSIFSSGFTDWQLGKEQFLWKDLVDTKLCVTVCGTLRLGGKSEVEEVRVPSFDAIMARKQIPIHRIKRIAETQIRGIQSEVEHLWSLSHRDTIKAMGCYRDRSNAQFYMLLWPAGNCDLRFFLEETCRKNTNTGLKVINDSWIQTWFGCLTSALTYLHFCNIQHEDIKPANIIHRGGTVYFKDLSSP